MKLSKLVLFATILAVVCAYQTRFNRNEDQPKEYNNDDKEEILAYHDDTENKQKEQTREEEETNLRFKDLEYNNIENLLGSNNKTVSDKRKNLLKKYKTNKTEEPKS
jgi:hypothetical protein